MTVLNDRIEALFQRLDAIHYGGGGMSNASKGTERELFVKNVLENVFPPHFRFSGGDIVDSKNNRTGQLDIVLEKPIGYSFPLAYAGPRLFLAENVAAVIEVKSNLISQWGQVLETSEKLGKVKPVFQGERLAMIAAQIKSGASVGGTFQESQRNAVTQMLLDEANKKENIGPKRIQFFVVGYTGWKTNNAIEDKLSDNVDGILILDQRKFATKIGRSVDSPVVEGSVKSLLSFLSCLENSFNSIANKSPAVLEYE